MTKSILIPQSVGARFYWGNHIDRSLSLLIPELKQPFPGEQGIIPKALRKWMVQHCKEVGGSEKIRCSMGNEGWSDVQDRGGLRKTSEQTQTNKTSSIKIYQTG